MVFVVVEIVCLLLEVLVRYRDTETGWDAAFVLKEAYDPTVDKGRHIQSWITEFRFCSLISSFKKYLKLYDSLPHATSMSMSLRST